MKLRISESEVVKESVEYYTNYWLARLCQIFKYIKLYVMKKIIFTSLIAIISLSTFAQGKSQKNKNKSESSVSKRDKGRDDDDQYDDRDNKDRKDKNDSYDERNDNRNDGRSDNRNNNNNKYSKNTPRKISDAFRRDFPNARNVTWTKNSGTWTANFGGRIFGNTNSATYRANGQRISTNGILGRRN